MSDLFSMTVDDYSTKELEDLFNLEHPYTEKDIKEQSKNFHPHIKSLNDENKKKFIEFLDLSIERLKMQLHKIKVQPKTGSQLSGYKPMKTSLTMKTNNDQFIIAKRSLNTATDNDTLKVGLINPLNRGTYIRTISLDSTFRNNYFDTSPSDFLITLKMPIKNVVSMKLAAIELPLSIYAISSSQNNNYLYLEWKKFGPDLEGCNQMPKHKTVVSGGEGDVTEINLKKKCTANIIIEDGNYITCSTGGDGIYTPDDSNSSVPSPAPCQPDIQYALNKQLQRGYPYGANGEIMAVLNPATGKITIGAVNGKTLTKDASNIQITDITLRFNGEFPSISSNEARSTWPGYSESPLQLKLGWLLGYRFGEYFNNTVYEGEGLYDQRGSRYIYLCVEDHQKNYAENTIGMFNDSLTAPENILARLSWNQYAYFSTTNNTLDITRPVRFYFGPVNIVNLRFRLVDMYGRTVNLNNMDYSIALEFTCIYSNG